MFKKMIMKKLKQFTEGNKQKNGHYRRGNSSSSSRGYKKSPLGGSSRYKRKSWGSSS